MTDLLKIREWLSISEATIFLSSKLNNSRVTKRDLAYLIEEHQINIYFKSPSPSCWLEIDRDFCEFTDPKSQIKKGQTEITTTHKHGHFRMCIESIPFNQSFANSLLKATELDLHNPWAEEHREKIYLVVSEQATPNIKYVALESLWGANEISFEYRKFYLDDLIDDFWLKRTELQALVQKIHPSTEIGENTEKQLAPKTENSYLKLIHALAEYATDGLTGKPSTDANAIEAALKSKSILCPVGNKALAGYLEKAQQIPK